MVVPDPCVGWMLAQCTELGGSVYCATSYTSAYSAAAYEASFHCTCLSWRIRLVWLSFAVCTVLGLRLEVTTCIRGVYSRTPLHAALMFHCGGEDRLAAEVIEVQGLIWYRHNASRWEKLCLGMVTLSRTPTCDEL